MGYSNEKEITKFDPTENSSSSVSQRISTYALELMKWWNGSPHENQQKDTKLPSLALIDGGKKNHDVKGGFAGEKSGHASSSDSNENSKKFSKGEYQPKDAEFKKPYAEDQSINKGKNGTDFELGNPKKDFSVKGLKDEMFVKPGPEDVSDGAYKKADRISIEMESKKIEYKISKTALPSMTVVDY